MPPVPTTTRSTSSRVASATTRQAGASPASTSSACLPMEPPEPRSATRTGGRERPGSAMDDGDPRRQHGRGEEDRVDPVEDPAVARDQCPGVLGAGRALEEALREVSRLGGGAEEWPKDEGLQRIGGRREQDERDGRGGPNEAPQNALE